MSPPTRSQQIRRNGPRAGALAVALFSALGCAETLTANPEDREKELVGVTEVQSLGIPTRTGNFTHEAVGSVVHTIVDATDYETYQHLDFDTGYADTSGWDLALRRFSLITNSGVSGDGGVQAVRIRGASFDEVTDSPGPDGEWVIDQPDGSDEDLSFDTVFNDGVDDWYDYDVNDHSLTSKHYTYVVRSTEGRTYKVQIDGYYDDVGTSGMVSLRWAEITPPLDELPVQVLPENPSSETPEDPKPADPEPPEEPEEEAPHLLVVDAKSHEDFVFVSLSGGVIDVADPQASTSWDLAFRRYVLLTNSGTSGPGLGGARLDTSGLPFEDLTEVETEGYVIDEVLPASGAPGSIEGTGNTVLEPWYDYGGFGALTPKEQTFVIRTAAGGYGKLRIHSYTGGVFEITFLPAMGL